VGRVLPESKPARIVLNVFPSLNVKHKFLQDSKQTRQEGFRLNGYLTKVQQEERSILNNEFQPLKAKGYKPSQLVYCHNDKVLSLLFVLLHM